MTEEMILDLEQTKSQIEIDQSELEDIIKVKLDRNLFEDLRYTLDQFYKDKLWEVLYKKNKYSIKQNINLTCIKLGNELHQDYISKLNEVSWDLTFVIETMKEDQLEFDIYDRFD